MDKPLIELSTTIAGKERKYVGRFLGFIKDDEFNALVQNSDKVSARLESKATQSIMEVAAKFSEMIGHRLVMTVKKMDDINVKKKMLFITEGLEIIDSVTGGKDKENGNNNGKDNGSDNGNGKKNGHNKGGD